MNVLFVDADAHVAESVSAVLRRKGHNCETVGNGAEAIGLIKQQRYDIVVLEVDLPDMDAFDVMQRIKRERLEIPVLLQSGQSSKSKAAEAAKRQGKEIFAKPYIVTELIERMQQLVEAAHEDDPGPEEEMGGDHGGVTPEANGQTARIHADNAAERRDDPRVPYIEAALIDDVSGPIPCVILNLSRGGAALKLPEPDRDCPSLFTLEQLDGPTKRCEMRWRKGDRIGVAFI